MTRGLGVAASLTVIVLSHYARPIQAEPGPMPREVRFDNHDDQLPPGAAIRLGTVRWRHERAIWGVAFSEDERAVYTCSGALLTAWDRGTGRALWRLAKDEEVDSLHLSRDARFVFGQAARGGIRVWDVRTGKEHATVDTKGRKYNVVDLSTDGKTVAGSYEEKSTFVDIVDVASGRRMHRFPFRYASVYTIAISPDGKTVAYAGSGSDICIVDPVDGRFLRELADAGSPSKITFSPNGKRIAATGIDGALRIWDIATGKLHLSRPSVRAYSGDAVAFSPDGKTIAFSTGTSVVLWDAITNRELKSVPVKCLAFAFAFSRDGTALATGGFGNVLQLWGVATGKPLTIANGHEGSIIGIAFSPDNRFLATASEDRTLRVWDLKTGKQRLEAVGHDGSLTQVVYTPDGRTLITGGRDETVRWWDASSGAELRLRKIDQIYNNLAISPDGNTLAVEAKRGEIHVLDGKTGVRQHILGQHKNGVGELCFAANGRVLVSTTYYANDVQLWNVQSNNRWKSLNYSKQSEIGQHIPPLVALSPDGRMLAAQCENGVVRFWEIASGLERRSIQTSLKEIVALAFSPDGRTLVVSNRYGDVRFWGLIHGREVGGLSVGRLDLDAKCSLCFTPDGQRLATILKDTTVVLWSIPPFSNVERSTPLAQRDPWVDLGSADAAIAFDAIRQLVVDPHKSVDLIAARLQPMATADATALSQLIGELDSDRFAIRSAATRRLEELRELAIPVIEQALREKQSAEATERLETILKKVVAGRLDLSAETLQRVRAIEFLELVATPEAVKVLRSITKGAPGARLTEEARESLARLAVRRGQK